MLFRHGDKVLEEIEGEKAPVSTCTAGRTDCKAVKFWQLQCSACDAEALLKVELGLLGLMSSHTYRNDGGGGRSQWFKLDSGSHVPGR